MSSFVMTRTHPEGTENMADNHMLCTKNLARCSNKEIREFIRAFPEALELSAKELYEYMENSYPDKRKEKSRKKREAAEEQPSEPNVENDLAEHVKIALVNIEELTLEKNIKEKFKMIRKGGPLSESILHGSLALKQIMAELPEPMNWVAPVPYWKVISCSAFIVGATILRYMDHPANASRILKYVDMILKAPNTFDDMFWRDCVLPIALELYSLMTDKDAKLPVPEGPRYYEDEEPDDIFPEEGFCRCTLIFAIQETMNIVRNLENTCVKMIQTGH